MGAGLVLSRDCWFCLFGFRQGIAAMQACIVSGLQEIAGV